jgi:iron complex transport system permease protein
MSQRRDNVHPSDAAVPISVLDSYAASVRAKSFVLFLLATVLLALAVIAIGLGRYGISIPDVIRSLLGSAEGATRVVVWNIRMPRITAAIVAGWALALSGTAIQCFLKNPLGSPSTLGISHGAAFGAAFAIVALHAGELHSLRSGPSPSITLHTVYSVTFFAFLGSMAATAIIVLLARIQKMSAEALILAGVALSSLFVSGTILLQYFASDTEIAAVVFWTFGDVARSSWQEIGITAVAAVLATLYFVRKRWDMNALATGDDSASALGVRVERERLLGMGAAAALSAFVTAFHGVIAFLGLLAPHIARRLVGTDHRFLIPGSCLVGAILLLLADTAGRYVVGSGALPVGVITSFMGGPLFLYLLITNRRR